MDTFLEALSTRNARTANGAITNSTSLNKCLDLFSLIGNHKDFSVEFESAFSEDPQLALRILFWSRDCRGGAGARKTFIEVMKRLQNEKPSIFSKVFKFIPTFGYWKDIYKLRPTPEVVSFVGNVLSDDKDHSLCAKYCPRKGEWFYHLRKKFNLSLSDFRHLIVSKTQVVENQICAKKWNEIDYETVPSIAGLRYSKLFRLHDEVRYTQYLNKVNSGEAVIHSDVLYPCDIFSDWKYNKLSNEAVLAMWNNLPNFMEGCVERILPLCDVSGSMMGKPMDVSVSLGCYLSERNEGPFKDAFMTFEEKPQLQILKGDIISRFRQLQRASWGGNTNLQAAFDLILRRAKEANLSQDVMPTKLLIISDMHFDIAIGDYGSHYDWMKSKYESTNFEAIKAKYAAAGYEMPGLIFWNVNGDAGNVPATMRDQNVGLVSGYSPSIIKSVLQAKVLTPMELMFNTVNSERYTCITL